MKADTDAKILVCMDCLKTPFCIPNKAIKIQNILNIININFAIVNKMPFFFYGPISHMLPFCIRDHDMNLEQYHTCYFFYFEFFLKEILSICGVVFVTLVRYELR